MVLCCSWQQIRADAWGVSDPHGSSLSSHTNLCPLQILTTIRQGFRWNCNHPTTAKTCSSFRQGIHRPTNFPSSALQSPLMSNPPTTPKALLIFATLCQFSCLSLTRLISTTNQFCLAVHSPLTPVTSWDVHKEIGHWAGSEKGIRGDRQRGQELFIIFAPKWTKLIVSVDVVRLG